MIEQCSRFCIFLNNFRSLKVNRCSMSVIECIKPYLYRRDNNAFRVKKSEIIKTGDREQ